MHQCLGETCLWKHVSQWSCTNYRPPETMILALMWRRHTLARSSFSVVKRISQFTEVDDTCTKCSEKLLTGTRYLSGRPSYDSVMKWLIPAPMIQRNLAQETVISVAHLDSGSTKADGACISVVKRHFTQDQVSQRCSNISNIRKLTILAQRLLRQPGRKTRISAVYAFTFLLGRKKDAQMFVQTV